MTYQEAQADSIGVFPIASSDQYTAWNPVLAGGEKPIEAYKVFQTKDAADTILLGFDAGGGDIIYDIYPGALVSVIKDTSENNGLYHVEPNNSQEVGAPKYKLVKVLTTETGGTGSITVKLKTATDSSDGEGGGSEQQIVPPGEEESKTNPYIFFVGVDSSASPQNDVSTMYFNDGVMYDSAGSTILSNSDERLKNIIGPVPVDFDELSSIQKVVFSWKSDKEKKPYIGTIAQSLEEVYPELVTVNPRTNTKMVNYNALAVVSLAAIDKLVERINQLEERVAALEK